MGLGTGILLIAVGAVMKWGITTDATGNFNVDTIGTILFVIGIIGTLLSLAFWNSWGGAGISRRTTTYDADAPRTDAYYDPAGAPRRTTVHEEVRDSRW